MAEFDAPEGEQSPADIEAARQAFLGSPPPILDPSETPAVSEGSTSAEEQAAIDEILANKPPAGSEGATTAPAPAPASPGSSPDSFVVGHDQFGQPITVSREQAYSAWQVQEALRTQDGVRALVSNGLTALGYSVEQVRAALENYQEPQGEPDPWADLDDDEPITVAQARALAAQAAQASTQQVADPLREVQAAIAQQQQAAVRSVTDQAVIAALGPVPTDDPAKEQAYRQRVDAIVNRGAIYYDPNQWNNPQHIQAAVNRAVAELNAEDEARFQSYLATKRSARAGTPPNTAGGAGTDGPLPEPKTMEEARKQARAVGFFQ
jgi:DNA-binding transcriptional MerR regulator